MNSARNVSLLLHAHLPYGLRTEVPFSLEEAWLHEATIDCYVPLLYVFGSLPAGKLPPIAVSLSPTLIEMWEHPAFPERFEAHLRRGINLFENEAADPTLPAPRRALASNYAQSWESILKDFRSKFQGKLLGAWTQLAQLGKVELLTTATTHAFLPAHQNATSRKLQIELGVERFTRLTGIEPKGFWLPECAYYLGLERDLETIGIEWFSVENMGESSLTRCPNKLLAISRHSYLSRKVWDARSGYPGNVDYREFHRDAIKELSHEKAGLFRLENGDSLPLGMKYWRVSGQEDKDWYDPAQAVEQARQDAHDFIRELEEEATDPITFLPFDAELFGHWWFEGPVWIKEILHLASSAQSLHLGTPTEILADAPEIHVGRPKPSTWGHQSDYSFWVNHETDWIYPLLQQADRQLAELLNNQPKQESTLYGRAIGQLTRELLLAQASDWPFMIRAGATANYARERIQRHLARFHYLAEQIAQGNIDQEALAGLEELDPILPDLTIERLIHS
ncbi:MAG: 1,4-alpha-glucan branching protein domain-containing protein [Verrucomicrobiota bacterium]